MSTSGIQLSGLATGLDTSSVISQLMAIERRPVQMMAANQNAAQGKLDRLRALNLKLSALQTAAKGLVGTSFNLSPFAAKTATSSNTSVFGASADATASTGSYSIDVQQLAREQRTGGGAFTSPAAAGTLRITADDGSFKDLNVAAGATINDVKDAINAGNMGMTASVVNNTLILTGGATGRTYTVDDGDGTNDFAASLGIDSAGKTYQAAQSAIVKVDNTFTVTSASNQVTNAISGVTLNLATTGTATVTVSRDNSQIASKVRDFIGKYNDVVNQVKEDTKYNAETKQGGKLLGDSFVSNLTVQMNRYLTEDFELDTAGVYGVDGAVRNYSSVGISVNRDGTLALDETKLNAAIAANPEKVFALFGQEDSATTTDAYGSTVKENTNRDGIANRLSAFIDSMISKTSMYNHTNGNGGRFEGGLLARITSTESLISSFDDRIEAYERRLELRERNIRNQFLAMEKSVASLRNQGNYLSGQLSQMAR